MCVCVCVCVVCVVCVGGGGGEEVCTEEMKKLDHFSVCITSL